jgi:hypothetical protein
MTAVDRRDYLLAELRCAALRARLWQADIEAVGLALKGGVNEAGGHSAWAVGLDRALDVIESWGLLRGRA